MSANIVYDDWSHARAAPTYPTMYTLNARAMSLW
jgi:hypothetical protein